ncbi:phosphate ABC transporter permease subunit PstC [Alicyclobacillus cycloheptanicus]|nr:phosphate ABC transporter permease subunit PstC [Alicyclobacillus cycloheptanicus]
MRRVSNRSKLADKVFLVATGICASSPVVFLLAITMTVLIQAEPSMRYMGWGFLTHIQWNLGNLYGMPMHKNGVSFMQGATFGALPFIVGTLASSVIALIIAVPVSIFTAMILAYQVRGWLGSLLSILVELLAGLPSVVIGLWGITVLAPWVGKQFGPLLTHIGVVIPIFKGPVYTGMGLLTSGITLALMIIPIITATTRDLMSRVPVLYREAGIGLGMTSFEVVRIVCLPLIRDGLVGAVALGWGRAMGETMAVLMVSGNASNYLPHNIYSPISTMASAIAAQLDSALTDMTHMAVHALAELALVLLIITVLTNWLARLLVNRASRRRGRVRGANA